MDPDPRSFGGDPQYGYHPTSWENMIYALWPNEGYMNQEDVKLMAAYALKEECGITRPSDEIPIEEALEIVNHYGYIVTEKEASR
jgi:hypothetical protein